MDVLIYLAIMILIILIWFMIVKRPIYEAFLISFFSLIAITNNWEKILVYVNEALSTSLLYSMIAFVAMSIVLTKTKVIDSCIEVILALVGHMSGGAGYTAVIASSFMGALSGSGPGNVMATGVITIPSMKRSGFPAELAANIESNASCMGNMVPPSSNIVAALGAFLALYPESNMTTGQFWIVLWGISLWFILQRLIMVWGFCKYYKVKPIPKEELPNLKETLKKGWKGLLLPVIIILPFVLDYFFKDTFFTERLGTVGAKYFSSSSLLFIGGIASIYACLICENKQLITMDKIAKMFSSAIKTITPTVAVCIFSYMIGAIFNDLNVAEELGNLIVSFNLSKFWMVLLMCTITCFMGMVMTGSSLIVIFGSVFISIFANIGVDPILGAAMLPCICGVMSHITPPLGLCMYAGMTIAESDFTKTFINNLWWVLAQFVLQVVVLMGWLPIIGL